MDKVKRPKTLGREEKILLKNEKYQEYLNEQIKTIYDKLDEIVVYINNQS